MKEQILKDEKLVYCLKCDKEMKALALLEQERKRFKVACPCGKDMTAVANSDGRAEELKDVVRYYCEGCARKFREGRNAGQKIDDYEVLKFIKEGGMGRVLKVYHKATGRILALKQILDLREKVCRKRFERETRYLGTLHHSNIIRFIDSGMSNEGPYLVMELAERGDIDSLMDNDNGYMRPDEAVKFMIEALKGLEFMHGNKIVHRDLKPGNILLQDSGRGKMVPKISDFGLAKQYSEAGGSVATNIGVALGTVIFMSPEQIKDTKNVREPADIYSMGITLYYLLTGRFPYYFPTEREVERFRKKNLDRVKNSQEALRLMMEVEKLKNPYLIILNDDPIPIRDVNPDIPAVLAKVVHRAIKKNISERYQSAKEFRKELEGLSRV